MGRIPPHMFLSVITTHIRCFMMFSLSLWCSLYRFQYVLFCRFLTLTTWFCFEHSRVVLTLDCISDPDYDVDAEVAIDPQDQDYFNELYQKFD